MMNSLFETFDPLMSTFSSAMLICSAPLIFMVIPLIINKSRMNQLLLVMKMHMFEEMSSNLNNTNKPFKILMLWSLFFFILCLNISSLLPYVYTLTSQMLFSLSLALPLWMSLFLFATMHNSNHFLSHLVPLSTPMMLSQFMVIIESISLIIRPITLSVRLSANMTAGHILMALCSKPIFMLNIFSPILMLLILLEIAVAFIQSYVFTMLTTMYLSENN